MILLTGTFSVPIVKVNEKNFVVQEIVNAVKVNSVKNKA